MISLHETIHVARDVAICYRYLLDFSTCEQWDPGVYRAVKRTPGTPRIGSEFEVTVAAFGRRIPLRYRIESLRADACIELSAAGDGLRSQEVISLRAVDDGHTEIDYRADFEFAGVMRAASRLAKPLFKRMGRRAVDGLQRALEIDPRRPLQGWLSYAADRSLIAAAPAFTERGYLALNDKAHSEYMDQRVVVVTGATSGIGRAAAAEYARLGATVILVGRNRERLRAAAAHVRDFSGCEDAQVAFFEADLLRVADTQALARRIAAAHPRIDVLVNNAGALFAERALTEDGFERTVAINLVAPFVLTEGLMDALAAARGRVVNMSSGGMYLQPLVLDDMHFERANFDGSKAYARAKRGLVALTRHWARRHRNTGIRFNAMHPGWVATPGVSASLPGFTRVMGRLLRDARMGADTAVWLGASSAAGHCNGEFFLDRRPHPTAVLPNTQVTPSQAQSLYAWLRNQTGIDGHGVG